jgi:hypothetical protein
MRADRKAIARDAEKSVRRMTAAALRTASARDAGAIAASAAVRTGLTRI